MMYLQQMYTFVCEPDISHSQNKDRQISDLKEIIFEGRRVIQL